MKNVNRDPKTSGAVTQEQKMSKKTASKTFHNRVDYICFLLAALHSREAECVAYARAHDGAFDAHVYHWTTPGGQGWTGDCLYYVDGDGMWTLTRNAAPGAPRWESIAEYVRSYWRPERAVLEALQALDYTRGHDRAGRPSGRDQEMTS